MPELSKRHLAHRHEFNGSMWGPWEYPDSFSALSPGTVEDIKKNNAKSIDLKLHFLFRETTRWVHYAERGGLVGTPRSCWYVLYFNCDFVRYKCLLAPYESCNHGCNFCSVFTEFAIEQKEVFPELPDGLVHHGERRCPTALFVAVCFSSYNTHVNKEPTEWRLFVHFLFLPDPPGVGVRSFGGATHESYDVQFPLARPTSGKVQAICLHSEHRPRYPQSYFPPSGYGHQKRRGSAVNRLESWYATCCRNNETSPMEVTLCCVTQAVSPPHQPWYCILSVYRALSFSIGSWKIFFLIHLLDLLGQRQNTMMPFVTLHCRMWFLNNLFVVLMN